MPNSIHFLEIYKDCKILKFIYHIPLQNPELVQDCFDVELPKPLKDYFKKVIHQHQHATRQKVYACNSTLVYKHCIFVHKLNRNTSQQKYGTICKNQKKKTLC